MMCGCDCEPCLDLTQVCPRAARIADLELDLRDVRLMRDLLSENNKAAWGRVKELEEGLLHPLEKSLAEHYTTGEYVELGIAAHDALLGLSRPDATEEGVGWTPAEELAVMEADEKRLVRERDKYPGTVNSAYAALRDNEIEMCRARIRELRKLLDQQEDDGA